MKNINKIWIFPLIFMGLIMLDSCKKDDDNASNGQAAVLATTAVSDIAQTTANCGGNITSDGGSIVTLRGVCWSTLPNPTYANSFFSNNGFGIGSFVSNITDLASNTTYYVRAYATNKASTSYGNELSFTTLSFTHSLSTNKVASITSSTAVSGGSIVSDGGFPINGRGVCWSTHHNPTIVNDFLASNSTSANFTSIITGLLSNTTYYVRAYATNTNGTAYGNEVSFTTLLGIGQNFQGGIIAYYLLPGDIGHDPNVPHGLITTNSDLSIAAEWGCNGFTISGADGAIVGTGNQNTIDIMNGCSSANIAARLCGDLDLNGYSDWYLPSINELSKLYINKEIIGGFSSVGYWSSTEYSYNNAWAYAFNIGYAYFGCKFYTCHVRAVRSF